MKNILKELILIIILFPSAISAQKSNAADTLLDHMEGKWVLTGVIDGKETTHDVAGEWVLGHNYFQLKEVSRDINKRGKPSYDAIVFITWDQSKNQYDCLWLDNTSNKGLSNQVIGIGKLGGNKIDFLFTFTTGIIFNTIFEYDKSANTWEWIMNGKENGKIQPFARVHLKRL